MGRYSKAECQIKGILKVYVAAAQLNQKCGTQSQVSSLSSTAISFTYNNSKWYK